MSQNAASQPPDGAPGSPMAATSGGDVAGEPAAAAFTALAAADIGSLSADDALAVAEQARVVAGFALAMEAEATARLRETYPLPVTATDADRRRAAIGEVQVGYGWSEAAAGRRVVLAEQLVELPGTLAALRTGAIDVPRALMIADRVSILAELAQRRAVEQVVLAAHYAAESGLTTRQWAVLLSRTITAIDPDAGAKRQQRTRTDRDVRLHRPRAAGEAAALVLSGPAESAAAADAAVDALARAWRDAGRDGTLAQLRYDAAIALLTGVGDDVTPGAGEAGTREAGAERSGEGRPGADQPEAERFGESQSGADQPEAERFGERQSGADRPGVSPAVAGDSDLHETAVGAGDAGASRRWQIVLNLSMPLSTLLGLDDGPCELDRAGVIPATVARRLAAHADVWRRILTDPVDGHVVTQAVRSYRPTKAMREFVLARATGVCAHRGCGHRTGLQLDHITPWPDGPTSVDNLGPFDQRHHECKTSGGWQHTMDPTTGAVTQTTPLGRRYTTAPLPPPGVPRPWTDCPACGWRIGTDLPPDAGWADDPGFDQEELAELRATLEAETDYDLIAKINAEELARLNGDP